MGVNYATFHNRRAYLSTEFGLELAKKWFNLTEEELEEKVGRFKKGKRKGLLKGAVTWFKVGNCGWVRTDHTIEYPSGFPVKHKIVFARGIEVDNWHDLPTPILGYYQYNDTAFSLENELAREYKKFLEEVRK